MVTRKKVAVSKSSKTAIADALSESLVDEKIEQILSNTSRKIEEILNTYQVSPLKNLVETAVAFLEDLLYGTVFGYVIQVVKAVYKHVIKPILKYYGLKDQAKALKHSIKDLDENDAETFYKVQGQLELIGNLA